jgi:hypothetical protein
VHLVPCGLGRDVGDLNHSGFTEVSHAVMGSCN